MTIVERLHRNKAHRTGFDPNCPKCLRDEGLDGLIDHLTKCALQNEKDSRYEGGGRAVLASCSEARAVASEQRRVLAILKLLRMVTR